MAKCPNLLIALHKSGIMIDVADADNGLSCECTCASCGDRLMAKQGDVKQWHFAHESGADCAGSVESALHLAAKQIIKETGLVYVGKHNPVTAQLPSFDSIAEHEPDVSFRQTLYDIFRHGKHSVLYKYASKETIGRLTEVKPKCERDVLELADIELEKRAESSNLVPDVTATCDGQKIYIEVVVTHFCDDDKIAKLKDLKVPVVELRLTPLMYTQFTLADVKRAIVSGQLPDMDSVPTWLVKPDYIDSANEYAYEFISESLEKFIAEGKDERDRKRAEMERLAAEALEREARKSKLRIFNTTAIVTEEKFSVSIWIPFNEDKTAFNEVSTVLARFKAKRTKQNWVVANPKLKSAIVDALNERSDAYINNLIQINQERFAAAQQRQTLKRTENSRIAHVRQVFSEQRNVEIEASRIQYQQEQERIAKLNQDELAQQKLYEEKLIETRRARAAARKEAVDTVIQRHRGVRNFKWRMKVMNDDLLAMGFGLLEAKDLPL